MVVLGGGAVSYERGTPVVHRACHMAEIGNLLPSNQRQRRTCYALCHILYPVSAAFASFFWMDSISTSFTFSFGLRNRAHFLPPRPVDSTAYLTPPSWASMARANLVHRSSRQAAVLGEGHAAGGAGVGTVAGVGALVCCHVAFPVDRHLSIPTRQPCTHPHRTPPRWTTKLSFPQNSER